MRILRTRRESILPKLMRLSALLFFAQALVSALLVRHVHAEVQNLMMTAGAQMMQLGERVGEGPPRTLRVNGAQIRLRVDHVPDRTVTEVLDSFQARCRSRNGRFYEQLQEKDGRGGLRKLDEQQLSLLDGVLRTEADEGGAIACLDVGDEKSSPQSILQRAQRFVQTGDTQSLGELRFLRVEKEESGVFAVMMWTDGPMNIKQMFPQTGDAPGIDFPDLPRPPGSRRVLSAWEEGQAPAINVYETVGRRPSALDAHYRKELPKHGWEAMTPPLKQKLKRGAYGMLAMRDGMTVTLAHGTVDGGRHGMTTIMPMDTRGATSVAAP